MPRQLIMAAPQPSAGLRRKAFEPHVLAAADSCACGRRQRRGSWHGTPSTPSCTHMALAFNIVHIIVCGGLPPQARHGAACSVDVDAHACRVAHSTGCGRYFGDPHHHLLHWRVRGALQTKEEKGAPPHCSFLLCARSLRVHTVCSGRCFLRPCTAPACQASLQPSASSARSRTSCSRPLRRKQRAQASVVLTWNRQR